MTQLKELMDVVLRMVEVNQTQEVARRDVERISLATARLVRQMAIAARWDTSALDEAMTKYDAGLEAFEKKEDPK